jgi:hypothetical protein
LPSWMVESGSDTRPDICNSLGKFDMVGDLAADCVKAFLAQTRSLLLS